jgi:hypothetical protein
LATALWPVIVMFFLIGIPAGLGYTAMLTLFQIQSPDRLRSRVFAALEPRPVASPPRRRNWALKPDPATTAAGPGTGV